MNHKVSISDLTGRYRSGYGLEQDFYTSQEVFEAEFEHIWKTHWIYAGNVCAIPKAGDYFLYRILKEEIILIRGNNGEIHAHYNSCTHRGSALCIEQKGHAAKLVCPYHQWVFDKDGTLLNARMMPEDFCREDFNLRSVQVNVTGGLIFICLADNPPDFTPIHDALGPYLQPFLLNNARVAAQRSYTLQSNWKLVAENFRECYHCGGAHPEYCNAVIGANLRENTSTLTAEKADVWNAKGLATALVEVEGDHTTYAVRYPLRPGVESYSIDGKRVSIPMGKHTDYDAGVVGLVNYPNMWVDAVSDYVWIMRVTPVTPYVTELEFYWLVDEKAEEGKDYDKDRLTAFWEVTGDQDGQLCENNYRGIQTSGYQPGPYAPVEDQVVNFVDWCVRKLQAGSQP